VICKISAQKVLGVKKIKQYVPDVLLNISIEILLPHYCINRITTICPIIPCRFSKTFR